MSLDDKTGNSTFHFRGLDKSDILRDIRISLSDDFSDFQYLKRNVEFASEYDLLMLKNDVNNIDTEIAKINITPESSIEKVKQELEKIVVFQEDHSMGVVTDDAYLLLEDGYATKLPLTWAYGDVNSETDFITHHFEFKGISNNFVEPELQEVFITVPQDFSTFTYTLNTYPLGGGINILNLSADSTAEEVKAEFEKIVKFTESGGYQQLGMGYIRDDSWSSLIPLTDIGGYNGYWQLTFKGILNDYPALLDSEQKIIETRIGLSYDFTEVSYKTATTVLATQTANSDYEPVSSKDLTTKEYVDSAIESAINTQLTAIY